MTVAPCGAAPLRVETGTSTAGVRTPPITLPWPSRAKVAGWVLARRKGGGLGGGRPSTTHLVEGGECRLCDNVLRAVVDGASCSRGCSPPPRPGRRRRVTCPPPPRSGSGGVRLLCRGIAELDKIGLGLEHEDRHLQVGADPETAGHAAWTRGQFPSERSSPSHPAVDEDAVEGVRPWLERIGERGQVERGLRLAHGDDMLGLQTSETPASFGPGARSRSGRTCRGVLIARVVE